MQRYPKPQFASWLIEQVNSGQYRGLYFVDQNKFRIPWKHNSKKDCNDEDIKIFKTWAEVSGKIKKFPNDKARWKVNFRNALSERFKMVKDNTKNDDPHKIYEVINTQNNYGPMMTQNSQEDSDMSQELFISPTDVIPTGSDFNLPQHFMALDLQNHTAVNPAPVIGSPNQPTIYDLEITIHYRSKEMLKRTLNSSFLQLHYQYEDAILNAYHLCFPSTEGLLDQKQIKLTNTILESIQRGVLLEVRDTGIYAVRQDRCRVFASTNIPTGVYPEPTKLPQNTVVELLNFENYVNELRGFNENRGGSPHYIINMCFGEKFPDEKPLEKKLVVVTVVPLICRYFHELAQIDGASSLHSSTSLQISHNSLFELINSTFSLPSADDALPDP
ncbi:interferon regulatory factor 7 isoform X2 [Gouania willdenowi]|uniref:interferon regulatory factor 7 isoform X2 n=1 Tax=Gouania willdenowi TaxID=441366 RepID=UPI00105695F3|nr:interferon regulatory factor 3-like isoform X2 [Gouania willdenowi]